VHITSRIRILADRVSTDSIYAETDGFERVWELHSHVQLSARVEPKSEISFEPDDDVVIVNPDCDHTLARMPELP